MRLVGFLSDLGFPWGTYWIRCWRSSSTCPSSPLGPWANPRPIPPPPGPVELERRSPMQRDLQPILQYPNTFHTHSTHGGSWRCMFIISYPCFPSQLAPCCSPDPRLQGLRPVVAPQLLWDVYRLLWKWAPHRTETRNIHATRYLMFKHVTKGYRIVIHTLAACSTLLHLLKAPAKSHHVQHDVIPRFRIFRQVNQWVN